MTGLSNVTWDGGREKGGEVGGERQGGNRKRERNAAKERRVRECVKKSGAPSERTRDKWRYLEKKKRWREERKGDISE